MWRLPFPLLLTLVLLPASLPAQQVAEIELRFDPEDGRVRPGESVVVQVVVYGYSGRGTQRRRVRLERGGADVRVVNEGMGWLSKPFRHAAGEDAQDTGGIRAPRYTRTLSRPGQASYQDAVLFTAAAERTGDAWIEAELGGQKASKRIDVVRDAPRRDDPERLDFGVAERRQDAYRALAENYAPFIAQQTWFRPTSDYLRRLDFDGNWNAADNAGSAGQGSSQAYVYYAAAETRSHWFLTYEFVYAGRYDENCVASGCPPNDSSGLILTVRKDGSRYGRLLAMETLAYGNVSSYRADASVRDGLLELDGDVELHDGLHPVVFVSGGDHGVFSSSDSRSAFSLRSGTFETGTGITYVYTGSAQRPGGPDARDVGYELLPAYDHLWLRAVDQGPSGAETFDQYFQYQPAARRPGSNESRLAGAFAGGEDTGRPFWAWSDTGLQRRRILSTGQWALDPAYAVGRTMRFSAPVAVDYLYNPYLGVGRPSRVVDTGRAERREVAPERPSTREATPRRPPSRGRREPAPSSPMPPLEDLRRFEPSQSSYRPDDENEGFFDLRFFLDGDATFYVRGDEVFADVASGDTPDDAGSAFTAGIPRTAFAEFTMEQRDGRGTIELLEEPSAQNGYVAKLRMRDPDRGDDRYHARLFWRVDPAGDGPIAAPEFPDRGKKGRVVSAATPRLPGEELPASLDKSGAPQGGSSGEFEFRGRIDGRAVFRIRGDRVYVESAGGRPVETFGFAFTQPLPAERLRDIQIERLDGRGSVDVIVVPFASNEFTAAIEVDDPRAGDDEYHFVVRWQR